MLSLRALGPFARGTNLVGLASLVVIDQEAGLSSGILLAILEAVVDGELICGCFISAFVKCM